MFDNNLAHTIECCDNPPGLVKSQLGGRVLDRYMLSLLAKQSHVTVQPFLRVRKPSTAGAAAAVTALPSTAGWTGSYTEWARLEVVRDLKEGVCRMPEAGFSESACAWVLVGIDGGVVGR